MARASTLTKITRLERLGGHRLRLRFSDDSEGVHDFTSMVKETGPMMAAAGELTKVAGK